MVQPKKIKVPCQAHSGSEDTFKGFADPPVGLQLLQLPTMVLRMWPCGQLCLPVPLLVAYMTLLMTELVL